MLCDLIQASHKVGLRVHPDKTKALRNDHAGATACKGHLDVGDQKFDILPRGEATMYLGRLLSLQSCSEVEVNFRLDRRGRNSILGGRSCAVKNTRLPTV